MECNNKMKNNKLITIFLAFVLIMSFSQVTRAETASSLLNQVVSLQLGLNGYVIGEELTADQKKIADENPVEGAYEGTYKFVDNGLYVVVNTETDRVLALYQQQKDADKDQLKAMVGGLMDPFGTPTTMAHEKLIYWAFNKHGAISENVFNESKKIKQTKDLGIIATVKLNSEIEIAPDVEEKEEAGTEKKDAPTGTIYFIITSDPLVKEFMEDHPQ